MLDGVQSLIDFSSAPAEHPDATATVGDVQKVVAILEKHGLQNARQICTKMGWQPTENRRRKVRAIARAARPGIISFPTSNGYKLAKNCTLDELHACLAAWDEVIKDATATKRLIQDYYYGRGGQ